MTNNGNSVVTVFCVPCDSVRVCGACHWPDVEFAQRPHRRWEMCTKHGGSFEEESPLCPSGKFESTMSAKYE